MGITLQGQVPFGLKGQIQVSMNGVWTNTYFSIVQHVSATRIDQMRIDQMWIDRMGMDHMRIGRIQIDRMQIERMQIDRMQIDHMRIGRMQIERMQIERIWIACWTIKWFNQRGVVGLGKGCNKIADMIWCS